MLKAFDIQDAETDINPDNQSVLQDSDRLWATGVRVINED